MPKLESYTILLQGDDSSELDEVLTELKEKYGENYALRLHIEVYKYPE